MELVDFDGLFDKKLTEYMKQNGGKRFGRRKRVA